MPKTPRNSKPGVRQKPRHVFKPHWDAGLRRLTLNGQLAKQFKRPAPCQEPILNAFQEQRWKRCTDDPLPRVDGKDPKQRLRDAVENLNRGQTTWLIRFRCNGRADGITWEPYEPD